EKIDDGFFRLVERGAARCKAWDQGTDLGVISPLIGGITERRTVPDGGERNFRYLGLATGPIRKTGFGRETTIGRQGGRGKDAKRGPPFHVSPPAGPRRQNPRE